MRTDWAAKMESSTTRDIVKRAGNLTAGELGVDPEGTIWECMVMSDIGGTGPTRFGAKNIGYPNYYHEQGEGPMVRVLRNPRVTVSE